METNTVKIDFVAGSHGNFLERILTTFMFKDPAFNSYNWFTENGSSHGAWHSDFANRPVQAWHWSDKKIAYKPNDRVIRICVKRIHSGIALINHLLRTNDSNVTIGKLDSNTAARLSQCEQGNQILHSLITDHGNKPEYTVEELSGLFRHKLINFHHHWQYCDNNLYNFDFGSFFIYDKFCTELESIAKMLEIDYTHDKNLLDIHSIFLNRNPGWNSWCRIQENQPDLDWFELLWKHLLESGQLD